MNLWVSNGLMRKQWFVKGCIICKFNLKKMAGLKWGNMNDINCINASGDILHILGMLPLWATFGEILTHISNGFIDYMTFACWPVTFEIQRFYSMKLWTSKDKPIILPRPVKVTQRQRTFWDRDQDGEQSHSSSRSFLVPIIGPGPDIFWSK